MLLYSKILATNKYMGAEQVKSWAQYRYGVCVCLVPAHTDPGGGHRQSTQAHGMVVVGYICLHKGIGVANLNTNRWIHLIAAPFELVVPKLASKEIYFDGINVVF